MVKFLGPSKSGGSFITKGSLLAATGNGDWESVPTVGQQYVLVSDSTVDGGIKWLDDISTIHNHDVDYVDITGDTMTGPLTIDQPVSASSADLVLTSDYFAKIEMTHEDASRTYKIVVDNGGNFRIDDTTALTTPFTIEDGVPSNAIYVTTSGDVGIGKFPSAGKLDVDGTVSLADPTASTHAATKNYVDTRVIPGVACSQNTDQTTSTATWTTVAWSDAEEWDTHGMHSLVSNNGQFTIPAGLGGRWNVNTFVEFSNSSGAGSRAARINHVGVGTHNLMLLAAATTTHRMSASKTILVNGGDQIEIQVWQNSGGNLDFTAGSVELTYVGPIS